MARGARRCRGRVRGVGAVPPGSDVRYRGDPGGAAHSIGVGRRVIGGIMRKSLSAQRCWNPPMCRAGPSAHGSPSAENQHSRKNPGIARKTRNRFVGTLLSDVQRPRTDREESDSPKRESARSPARPSPAGGRHPPPHPSRPPHRRSRREKLNAPTGAWCSLTDRKVVAYYIEYPSQCTYRCAVLPDKTFSARKVRASCLNAPTGARCSLTVYQWRYVCRQRLVSMHLQVRGAP